MFKVSKYKIGKYFSIIKSGYLRHLNEIKVPYNKFNKNLSIFLLKQGLINGFIVTSNLQIKISLKYYKGLPLITLFNNNEQSYNSIANFKLKRYYKTVNGYTFGLTIYNTSKGFYDVNKCLLYRQKGNFVINLI